MSDDVSNLDNLSNKQLSVEKQLDKPPEDLIIPSTREEVATNIAIDFEKIPDELKLDYLVEELDRVSDLITTETGYREYGGEYARLSVLSFLLIDKIAQDKFPNVGDDREREAERLAGKILMPPDILNINHVKRNLILIGDNLKQQQKIDEDVRRRISIEHENKEEDEDLETILKKELFSSIFLGKTIRKMANQEVDEARTREELKNMSPKRRITWVKMTADQMLSGYQELTKLVTSLLNNNNTKKNQLIDLDTPTAS